MKLEDIKPLIESDNEGRAVTNAPPPGGLGEFITSAQAAKIMGYKDPSRIRQLIDDGKLTTHKPEGTQRGQRDHMLKRSEVQKLKTQMDKLENKGRTGRPDEGKGFSKKDKKED